MDLEDLDSRNLENLENDYVVLDDEIGAMALDQDLIYNEDSGGVLTNLEIEAGRELRIGLTEAELDLAEAIGLLEDMGMMASGTSKAENSNLWIGDTGASCHMKSNTEGMYDLEVIEEDITIGSGSMKATLKGKFRGFHVDKDGNCQRIRLDEVKVVPELKPYNLFSMTAAIQAGMDLGNKGKTLFIQKGNFKLVFDHELRTKTGYIGAAEITPRTQVTNELAAPALSKGGKISISWFHSMLGHHSKDITQITAKYYEFELTGQMDPCESCLVGKAR